MRPISTPLIAAPVAARVASSARDALGCELDRVRVRVPKSLVVEHRGKDNVWVSRSTVSIGAHTRVNRTDGSDGLT